MLSLLEGAHVEISTRNGIPDRQPRVIPQGIRIGWEFLGGMDLQHIFLDKNTYGCLGRLATSSVQTCKCLRHLLQHLYEVCGAHNN